MIKITDKKFQQIQRVLPQIKDREDLNRHYSVIEVLDFVRFFDDPGPSCEIAHQPKIEPKPASIPQMALL